MTLGRHEATEPLVVRVMPGVVEPWTLVVIGKGKPLRFNLTQEQRKVFSAIWTKIEASPGLALDLTINREHIR